MWQKVVYFLDKNKPIKHHFSTHAGLAPRTQKQTYSSISSLSKQIFLLALFWHITCLYLSTWNNNCKRWTAADRVAMLWPPLLWVISADHVCSCDRVNRIEFKSFSSLYNYNKYGFAKYTTKIAKYKTQFLKDEKKGFAKNMTGLREALHQLESKQWLIQIGSHPDVDALYVPQVEKQDGYDLVLWQKSPLSINIFCHISQMDNFQAWRMFVFFCMPLDVFELLSTFPQNHIWLCFFSHL